MDGEAQSTFQNPAAAPVAAHGRWIGMLKVSRRGLVQFNAVLRALRLRADFDTLDLPALLNALIADGAAIEVLYVHGHWRGVNDLEDFRRAGDFAHAQSPPGGAQGVSFGAADQGFGVADHGFGGANHD
jgi:phosphoenolpyruvate phosphomutase